MAGDPVCGMDIEVDQTKHQVEHMGTTYFFCTSRCKASFGQDPERFIGASETDVTVFRKVVIVGAGQVGATFAYALMINGVATSIVIIDQDRERAEGHVMDLNHGLAFVSPSTISVGDYSD